MRKNLSRFVKGFRPEVLHAQNLYSVPAVANVARMHGILGVAHVRDHRFECFTSRVACQSHHDANIREFSRCVGKPLHAALYPYAKMVTKTIRGGLKSCGRGFAISEYIRREVLRDLPLDIRTSYIGVDLAAYKKIPLIRYCAKSKTVGIYLGGFSKEKGIFELLNGFKEASKRVKDLMLLVAGNGKERGVALEFVRKEHLQDKVILLGALSHESTISAIKGTDFVLVPSILPEAASRSTIESLVCGKPILGSNRGAIPELVGNAGMTFAPSAANIEKSILTLVSNAGTMRDMKWAALKRSEMFSIRKNAKQILQAYHIWLDAGE